jgi:hypothetical protein
MRKAKSTKRVSENTELRILYAGEKIIMHNKLNHMLVSNGIPKKRQL